MRCLIVLHSDCMPSQTINVIIRCKSCRCEICISYKEKYKGYSNGMIKLEMKSRKTSDLTFRGIIELAL